jgi:hypothetical protein
VRVPDEQASAPVSVMLDGPTLGSGDSICSGSRAYSYSSATLDQIVIITQLT